MNTLRRRSFAVGRALIACLVLCLAALPAVAETYRAEAVKAAFLFRFTGYVDWPLQTLSQPMFTIAVLGSDPVAEELARLLPGHSIRNLPARARSVQSVEDLGDAQVLYVGPGYEGDLRSIVSALAGQAVLVVTDRERSLDQGSAVNFLLIDQRVRFEVSLPAAAQAGLKLDPALLSVAARVLGSPRSDIPCLPVLPSKAEDWVCLGRLAGL